jgi:hypothetical protein
LKYVTITEDEYEELTKAAAKLNALERAGVDNWEWYYDALESMNEDNN